MKAQQRNILDKQDLNPQYWIKIYTKTPYCIYFFGPFSSPERATNELTSYTSKLEAEGRHITSCFQFTPTPKDETLDSCSMTHNYWLQSLMEDQLHMKVSYTQKETPTVIEHHTTHDALLD